MLVSKIRGDWSDVNRPEPVFRTIDADVIPVTESQACPRGTIYNFCCVTKEMELTFRG